MLFITSSRPEQQAFTTLNPQNLRPLRLWCKRFWEQYRATSWERLDSAAYSQLRAGLASHPWLGEELVHYYSRPTDFMMKTENPKGDKTVWVYGTPPVVVQKMENRQDLQSRDERRVAVALTLSFCSSVIGG